MSPDGIMEITAHIDIVVISAIKVPMFFIV
jgi:hypothetical protein